MLRRGRESGSKGTGGGGGWETVGLARSEEFPKSLPWVSRLAFNKDAVQFSAVQFQSMDRNDTNDKKMNGGKE